MNVSTLSGQPTEKKNKGASPDDDVVSVDSSHGQVPCSDPDFIRGGKSGIKGSPPQQKIAAEGDKQSVKSDSMNSGDSPGKKSESSSGSPGKKSESSSGSSGFYSPMLARRSRLEPPKVKRSRSLTRLTEAINQIHNLCVFPAQPAVAPEVSQYSEFENKVSKNQLTRKLFIIRKSIIMIFKNLVYYLECIWMHNTHTIICTLYC